MRTVVLQNDLEEANSGIANSSNSLLCIFGLDGDVHAGQLPCFPVETILDAMLLGCLFKTRHKSLVLSVVFEFGLRS